MLLSSSFSPPLIIFFHCDTHLLRYNYSERSVPIGAMFSYMNFVDLLFGTVGIYLIKSIFSATSPGPLPPGPKPLPLIDNLLDLPQGQEWVHWTKYAKLYGKHAC